MGVMNRPESSVCLGVWGGRGLGNGEDCEKHRGED